MTLQEGDKAPAFTAAAGDGRTVNLSDFKGRKVVNAHGVRGDKPVMGRKRRATRRMTFLIAPDGRIRKIWRQVSPAEHAREVVQERGA